MITDLNPTRQESATIAGNEFSNLLHRILIGAKTAGHVAEDDYRNLYEEFTGGERDVADHAADEVQLLQSWGEHDLAREMIITAVHDAQAINAAIAAAVQAETERIEKAAGPLLDYLDAIPARRPDEIGIASIDRLDNGKVSCIALTVGDLRKLAAAIRARGNGAGRE